jgi:hypothetical protein
LEGHRRITKTYKHKVFWKDKSYGPRYQPMTKKELVSTSTIHKTVEQQVFGTWRSKKNESNAKISTTIWHASSHKISKSMNKHSNN